jgi:hypothetical protein
MPAVWCLARGPTQEPRGPSSGKTTSNDTGGDSATRNSRGRMAFSLFLFFIQITYSMQFRVRALPLRGPPTFSSFP